MISKTECKRCGWCCENIMFDVGTMTRKQKEWITTRGIEIINGKMIIPQRCKFLSSFKEEFPAKCMIYPIRPGVCKIQSCPKGINSATQQGDNLR